MNDKTITGMRAPELRQLYKETIEDINAIKAALINIEEQKKQATDAKILIAGNEETEGILNDVKGLEKEANEKLTLIREIHAELFGDDEEEGDEGMKGELEELSKEFQDAQLKIKSTEKELYGHKEKNEAGEEKHVDGLMDKIKNFFEIQQKKYNETYNKIENELLAGATTVGLSKAYNDKADTYNKPNRFWLAGFFISVGFIIIILFFSLKDTNEYFSATNIKELSNLSTGKLVAYFSVKLIIRIGIITSLIWAASFMGKRYSQNKRLAEEYSYKATIAKSFEGYRKRAEELDQVGKNQGLSEKLMNNMIEMSAYNPVVTMESKSHKEKHPSTAVIEKAIDVLGDSLKVINKIK